MQKTCQIQQDAKQDLFLQFLTPAGKESACRWNLLTISNHLSVYNHLGQTANERGCAFPLVFNDGAASISAA